ncbi:MAG: NADPH-dependent F420 reductase [Myxococcota bacterium]
MRIGLVGGTGKEGRGLAMRWARAGHDVRIGSRDAERGRERAAVYATQAGAALVGGDNRWAVEEAEVVVLSVPYGAHKATLTALAPALKGKILVDITVPLKPPRVREVHLPEGESAALEAQAICGPEVRVVATLHHVSSVLLAKLDEPLHGDVLVCSDDADAREQVMALIRDLDGHPVDAGGLRNAIALEAMTPVLLYMNKRYATRGAGLAITHLDKGDGHR